MQIPETQTVQLNADGPLDSEMPRIMQDALRRVREGGVTRFLDGDRAIGELVPAVRLIQGQAPEVQLIQTIVGEHLVLVEATGADPYESGEAEGSTTALDFHRELASVINRYSRENRSNTPDFILAEYLEACLKAFESSTQYRDHWYSVKLVPGDSHFVGDDSSATEPE